MELSHPNGDRVSIRLLRYQFPETVAEEYDANWLVVRTYASLGGRHWVAEDPSLLTWEVSWLIDWLEGLATGGPVDSECSFLEPNLRFEATERGETTRLSVIFGLESRPPWMMDWGPDLGEACVNVVCSPKDLAAAAESLRNQRSAFPLRGAATRGREVPTWKRDGWRPSDN